MLKYKFIGRIPGLRGDVKATMVWKQHKITTKQAEPERETDVIWQSNKYTLLYNSDGIAW